jgi:hypothetical protein
MVDEDVLNDIALAQKIVSSTDSSIVIIQYNKIWKQKKDEGIRTLIEVIDEMGDELKDTIIGINFLDKASAMLCRYAKVKGVHAPKGTKTGIALLIMGGITSQVNEMIQVNKDELSSFDKLLNEIESPEEAYKIIKKAIK